MTANEALAKCNGNRKAAAALLGLPRTTFQRRLSKEKAATAPAVGRSLAEFRSTYDKDTIVPAKLSKALKELGASWVYEQELIKLAGVSTTDISNYRGNFEQHIVVLRGDKKRVWAGTAALAKQMRELV